MAGDISFDPNITQEEFRDFSARIGEAIFASPVDSASGTGVLGFDIGIAATAVPVDENASYWLRATGNDFAKSGYVIVPRIVASKGLGLVRVSASFAKVPDSDIQARGGSIDLPIIRGGLIRPSLSLRGSYSQLSGIDVYKLKTYGAEVFLSKGFPFITPYVGAGIVRTNARGTLQPRTGPAISIADETDQQRVTLGVKLSIPGPRVVIEATQGKERSYAARVSLGL